jgi:hypothetical protein
VGSAAVPPPACARLLPRLLQESKAQACSPAAIRALVHHLSSDHSSDTMRVLCCEALTSLARLIGGRTTIAAGGGVSALTAALAVCPAAAVKALKVGRLGSCAMQYVSAAAMTQG